jgi:hypothetical protein
MPDNYRASDYRTARTLCEAFGPYARLTIEQPQIDPPTVRGYIASFAVALLIGAASWAVQQ